MISFEQVVRPFRIESVLALGTTPARTVEVGFAQALMIWGKSGTIPAGVVDPGAPGTGFKLECCTSQKREVSREHYDPQRIQDPNNPDNYVMLQQTKSITVKVVAPDCGPDLAPDVTQAFVDFATDLTSDPTLNITTMIEQNSDCKDQTAFKQQPISA